MCEVYPNRREELYAYPRDVVEMSYRFGSGSYDYHRAFSAKLLPSCLTTRLRLIGLSVAKNYSLQHSQVSVLLTVRIARPYYMQLSSVHKHRVLTQASPRYPRSRPNARVDNKGRPHILFDGREICNLFNGAWGCFRQLCSLAHICLKCKQPHSALHCTKANDTHTTMPKVTGTQHVGTKPSQTKSKA